MTPSVDRRHPGLTRVVHAGVQQSANTSTRRMSARIAGSSGVKTALRASRPAMTTRGVVLAARSGAELLATTTHEMQDSPPATRGRRSAERRMPTMCRAAQTSVRELAQLICCAAARHIGARPPSGASTAALAGTPIPTQLQAMLPGSRIKRALPALSCPSSVAAPHASAVVPKGMMPGAAPARLASPRGSTALAPHFRSHPECVPR